MPPQIPAPTPHIPRLLPAAFPGFINTARVNPDLVLDSRGAASFQFGCGQTHGFAVCGDDDYTAGEVKCRTGNQANIVFKPRTFYALRECGDLFDEIDWQDVTQEDLLVQVNHELSQLLEFDAGRNDGTTTQNPSLISTARNLTPGSAAGVPGDPVSVTRALQLLLAAFQTVGNGYGSFHGSSTLIPWGTLARQITLEGNTYRGPLNLPFNPGPGFRGARPITAGGAADGSTLEADDQTWLYGVGGAPVQYRVGLDSGFSMREELANYQGYLAEHKAIVRFNTCAVFAVLVRTNDINGLTI